MKMKIVLAIAAPLLVAGMIYQANFSGKSSAAANAEGAIQWMTWEEAIKKSDKNPKKIFVDVYTDWCGWCKKMDASTFADPKVAEFINKNFYPVKFNAEQPEDIVYKGNTLKFVAEGRRGYHQLASALLDGRMGYPSYVYLDEQQNRITISPGFKPVDVIMKELNYVAGNHYKTITLDQFQGR
jgi:thioredoxin-related protein